MVFYLVYKVFLNYVFTFTGSQDSKWTWNSKSHDISKSVFPKDLLNKNASTVVPAPYEKNNNELVIVNEKLSFEKMINELKCHREISLDLEGNNDHSYLGTTGFKLTKNKRQLA